MTCPGCGAAMADDQRYCLNCGQRRGEPRVDFHRHLDSQATAVAEAPSENGGTPAAEGAPQPERLQRDYAPLAAAGGIAVLGLMLLIGVLIGRGTGDSSETAATPQVITVGAAESSRAEPETEAGTAGEAGKGGGQGSDRKPAKRNAAAGGSADTGKAPVASEGQLEALQEKTGEDYAKESAKLPDEIATPGAPPPTDDKAPGGGSGGVTLE